MADFFPWLSLIPGQRQCYVFLLDEIGQVYMWYTFENLIFKLIRVKKIVCGPH